MVSEPCQKFVGVTAPNPNELSAKTDPWGPEPSTLHLAPRAFSAGVVVSLGEGFVLKRISELNSLLDRFVLTCLSSCYEKDYFSY